MNEAIERAAACLSAAMVCLAAGATPRGTNIWIGPSTGGNFRKADASGFTGNLVVKGGKAVLNRTFKPVAREVAAGAEIVWIEAGTMLIFR